MKQEQSKVCPACGSRNKAKWEFCARCGESLQSVELAADASPKTVVIELPEEEQEGSALGLVTALLFAVVGVVVMVVLVRRTPEPENPVNPAAFQFSTLPPAPPQPSPSARGVPVDSDFDLGRRLLAQGDLAGAVRALAQAVEKLPLNPDVHSIYAQALFATGSREEGLRHFEEAARLSPDLNYRIGFAAALNTAGRAPEAIEQYQQVLSSNPSDQQALKELGSLLNRQGQFVEAASYLARAAEVNPTDLALQQDLAWAQEAGGSLEQAAETYRRLLGAAPQAAVSRTRLAEVLLRQQKPAEALAVVEDGLGRTPSAPLLKRARASLLERSGRIAEAIAEYRDYARVAPNPDDARVIIERVRALEQRAGAGSSS